MVTALQTVLAGVVVVAGAGYVAVARTVHGGDEFPGRRSFVLTCVLTSVFLAGYVGMKLIGHLVATTESQETVATIVGSGYIIVALAFGAAIVAPLVWVRFALLFTGQRVPTDRRTFLTIGFPVVVGLVTIAIWAGIPILVAGLSLGPIPDWLSDIVTGGAGYILLFVTFYLAALLVVGASLIWWTGRNYRHLSTRGGALLSAGVVLPWAAVAIPRVSNAFENAQTVMDAHAAAGGALGIVALWAAVSRYGQFETVPAAGTVGRDVTVEEMNDPVVVVDEDHQIVDLNPAADRAFDASVDSIGEPLSAVFDGRFDTDVLHDDDQDAIAFTHGQRTYEATTSALRGERGRRLGHSIVFHDVSDRERREQRIQVLNRVLRHNLRNDLNTVNGYAQLLAEKPDGGTDYALRIQETASDLIAIGEKAREIEDVVASKRRDRTASLGTVIDRVVEEVRVETPGCEVLTDVADAAADRPVNDPILTSVLRELAVNACEHNDADEPRVELTAGVDDGTLTVSVADNGPGVPDHELTPIREGTETALEHGSGLGLWLVKWGVMRLDGRIDFAENDPRGTVATLRLPAA